MPKLSVWFIRVALICLCFGFTVGGLLLWNKGMLLHPMIWLLLPAHMEFLLVGWMVQLALGVAFWILPRWQSSRGDTRPAWLALFLLNAGVLLVACAPFVSAIGWFQPTGRLLEAVAVASFAIHAWPRVKPWFEPT